MRVFDLRFLLAACSLALASCATKTANMCPDTPAPKCVTDPVCSTDPSRGCQVCRCSAPAYVPIEQKPPGQ